MAGAFLAAAFLAVAFLGESLSTSMSLTPAETRLAIKASKAMGGGILGIDMMEDEEKGIVVHEVNNTVEPIEEIIEEIIEEKPN